MATNPDTDLVTISEADLKELMASAEAMMRRHMEMAGECRSMMKRAAMMLGHIKPQPKTIEWDSPYRGKIKIKPRKEHGGAS